MFIKFDLNIKWKLKIIVNLFLTLWAISVFASPSEPNIKVGVSCSLIADIVKNIGGKRVEISLFPNWKDCKAMFWLGPELEPKIFESIQKLGNVPQERLLGYIPRIDENYFEYFDPLAVKSFIYRVSKVLKLLDPAGEGYYQKNLARYTTAIDGSFKDGKWSISKYKCEEIYTLSPHFSYLLRAIGLKEVRVSLEKLHSLKGIVIDDPDNPIKTNISPKIILVKLYYNLTPEIKSYLNLLKENFILLSFALSHLGGEKTKN